MTFDWILTFLILNNTYPGVRCRLFFFLNFAKTKRHNTWLAGHVRGRSLVVLFVLFSLFVLFICFQLFCFVCSMFALFCLFHVCFVLFVSCLFCFVCFMFVLFVSCLIHVCFMFVLFCCRFVRNFARFVGPSFFCSHSGSHSCPCS